ncbi:hypothetical protein ACFSTD_05655 [Novosphingobium colocasiae]
MKLHGDLFAQTSNYFSSTGKSLNPHTRIPGYALANFRLGVEQKDKGFFDRRAGQERLRQALLYRRYRLREPVRAQRRDTR